MKNEIDEYLAQVSVPERRVLESLRKSIRAVVPEAQECLSYKIPAFRVDGHVVAGFAAYKGHLSFFPFSGSVLDELDAKLGGRTRTKSALHFTTKAPLPQDLVGLLLKTRLAEVAHRGR